MDNQPELLAQHYTEAGLIEKSVIYWGKAGHRSTARAAMAEAAAQFYKGLDQLALLPDGPGRQRKELEFRSALGGALQAAKGYAAPETGRAYARAQQLWEQLGSPVEFLRVPVRQSVYHAIRGELDLALRLDEEMLRLSRQHNEYAGLVLGHISSGRELMYMGRFTSSRLHLGEVLALYDPISHHSAIHRTGDDPHVVSLAFLGIVLFCLGYPDQALARSNGAIAEARRLAHPPSLAQSLTAAARLLSLVGDNPGAAGGRAGFGGDRARFPPLARGGNDLSRVAPGKQRQCDGGIVSPAQRFHRPPLHWGGVSEALSYRSARQSTRDRRAD
jgi:tetratricopeptide (TPR) repeat protein